MLSLVAHNNSEGEIVASESAQPFAWEKTYDEQVRDAYRLIAQHVYPVLGMGEFAYRAFEHINTTFYGGRLPEPLILWDITEWGHCLGWTRSPADGPPIIKLHPSLVAPVGTKWVGGETIPPWGGGGGKLAIPDRTRSYLGFCYAFDVLLHETVHAAVNYLLGGIEAHPDFKLSWTSHQNPLWIAEVNRIAGLMGAGVTYDMKKYRRVPTGELNDKGRPVTRLKYGCKGPEPEHFPHNLPGAAEFYLRRQLPFAWGHDKRPVESKAGGKTGCV